ncbi:uncharacterized protein [Prorops nasuta]|uniref:uncharacterized protein n=1 Tax=Prorops nasuta TaxID=863751 RepID=UPI0034CD04B0
MNQREKDLITRGQIIALKRENYSNIEIARKLNLHRQTVSKWIDRYRENGLEGLSDHRKENHGVAKTTAEENRIIRSSMENNPFQASARVLSEINLNITPKTVRNILHREGVHCHRPCRKIKYTNEHRERRVGFSLEYLGQQDDCWDNTIWTDEKEL